MKFKHLFFFGLALLLCAQAKSQAQKYSFWVAFTDKNNSPYSVDRPQEFLGPKGIERRKNQNINTTLQDLPVNPAYIAMLKGTGARIVLTSRWLNAATVIADSAALPSFKALGFVSKVERLSGPVADTLIESAEKTEPEPMYGKNYYGKSYQQIAVMRGDTLHNLGFSGRGMTIAVIDAGFLKVDTLEAFRKLREDGRILGVHDFVDADGQVYDAASHGMLVLGALAAYVPNQIIGTAPDAAYYLLRSENAGSEYPIEEAAWVSAAEYADSAGAWLINSSLGYTTYDDPSLSHTYAELDGKTAKASIAAGIAVTKGILVCNSAGNSGRSPWRYITVPADAIDILTVGAVDINRNVTSFSSRGPSPDGRVKPDVCAVGFAVATASLKEGEVGFANGTSLSSPLLAGMAACLWQAFPGKTNYQVMDAIRNSSHLRSMPNDSFGYGIPDFSLAYQMLKNPDYGKNEKSYIRTIFPNPFSNQVNVAMHLSSDQKITVRLTDLKGRQLTRQDFELNAGFTTITVDYPSSLINGTYIITVNTKEGKLSRRITKAD